MPKKQTVDVIDAITQFQQTIFSQRPEADQMRKEVRLMKFRVRPVKGDLSELSLSDDHFIEILWSLGKLDEFYSITSKKVSAKQRTVFNRLYDDMYVSLHRELNRVDINKPKQDVARLPFELEIYRERRVKMN